MVATACLLGLTLSSVAFAQEPPLLADMPESETVTDGKPLDVLGIRLGSTYDEAFAALTKAAGVEPKVMRERTGIGDNRGNQTNFDYTHGINARLTGSPGSGDSVRVAFSTALTGRRVQKIERTAYYHNQQASIPDFRKALVEKYGSPSLIAESQQYVMIYYVWFNGKKAGSGETVPYNLYTTLKQLPFSCARLHPERYAYGKKNGEMKGCDTVIEVRISRGSRADLANAITTEMHDLKRYRHDQATGDAYLKAELDKATKGKTGLAPRL